MAGDSVTPERVAELERKVRALEARLLDLELVAARIPDSSAAAQRIRKAAGV